MALYQRQQQWSRSESEGTMKTLMLMRHAKSSWADPGMADFDRPLNARGLEAAPLMGTYLKEHDWVPDRVISSSANRAQQTTKLVLESLGSLNTEYRENLYLASASAILNAIREQPPEVDRLLMVGHNPGLEHLVSELLCRFIAFPTAAVAIFQADIASWSKANDFDRWELVEMKVPKEL